MITATGTHCLNLKKKKNETCKHFPNLLKCLNFENKEKNLSDNKIQLHFYNIYDHIFDTIACKLV